METKRIPFDEMAEVLEDVLLRHGLSQADATLSARLFTETTCDGVYSHGLGRFPSYIRNMETGYIDPTAACRKVAGTGAIERWDGAGGPGNLNAYRCMDRAVDLALSHGVGVVALANTNHWMRAGTYGWQAADRGVLAMLWTNTIANLPPWGATQPGLGNNPMVLAVPRKAGHVVLDFAQSQYSYGTLEQKQRTGERLPYPGGFTTDGRLTDDPEAILESKRPLPIGMWKGAGLSMLLDLFATLLSGGRSTAEISADPVEHRVSQVFIAISPEASAAGLGINTDATTEEIIAFAKSGAEDGAVRYPGERVLRVREENRRLGIPVDSETWDAVQRL
jgi:3-dehydro-L-gulonate 2-dehydrogenase